MMPRNSTWLLLKTIRMQLVIFALINASLMFLLDLWLGLDFSELPGMAIIPAIILVTLLRLPARFARSPFPVTDRQVAWLPAAATLLLWMAGLGGIVTGQSMQVAHDIRALDRAVEYWTEALTLFPAALFVMLLTLRLATAAGNAGVCLIYLVIPFLRHHALVQAVFQRQWLPLLAATVILFLDAPSNWALRRRQGLVAMPSGSTCAPVLPGPLTLLIQILLGALSWFILYDWANMFILEGWRNLLGRPLTPSDSVSILFLLFTIFIVYYYWLTLYRQHRASGLRPRPALLLVLLRSTIALEPLAPLFGVRQGALIRCPFCRQWRFIWQAQCSHCGRDLNGAPVMNVPSQPVRSVHHSFRPRQFDSAAMYYYVVIPGMLIWLLVSCK